MRMNTQIHLRTSSATSNQKMTSEPSPRAFACRWLDSLMLHVRRSTKLINRARGYTGSGYSRRVRRPYGCVVVTGCGCKSGCGVMGGEEGADDCVVVLFRGEAIDSGCSCITGRASGRAKEAGRVRLNFGVNCKRLKPQSFVTSHQKEYKELIRAESSLKVQPTQRE